MREFQIGRVVDRQAVRSRKRQHFVAKRRAVGGMNLDGKRAELGEERRSDVGRRPLAPLASNEPAEDLQIPMLRDGDRA